ncbi:hypothetical protein GCM10009092_24850 [Bowmanella denitrificans]|uniref:Transposase n=1 Tax=Bowmanella denitrificans TaxID=366582 RepID=A0ABN0XBR6_9ALTE
MCATQHQGINSLAQHVLNNWAGQCTYLRTVKVASLNALNKTRTGNSEDFALASPSL